MDLNKHPVWYQKFTDYVATLGFSDNIFDHSLFIYCQCNHIPYIILYMDDILIVVSSYFLRQFIMTKLDSEFTMNDLGHFSYFLCISVTRNTRGIFSIIK